MTIARQNAPRDGVNYSSDSEDSDVSTVPHSESPSALWMTVRGMTARALALPWQGKLARVGLMCSLLTSFSLMFFGLNWWLKSFGSSPAPYMELLIPSVIWAALMWLVALVFKLKWPKESLTFYFPRSPPQLGEEAALMEGALETKPKAEKYLGIKLVLLLGLFDCLGGLTSVYSIPHVPQFLQAMLYSTGPMVTWMTARVFHPVKAAPMNRWLALTFVLVTAAVVVASISTIKDLEMHTASDYGWLLVFFASSSLPPLYNVVQGKFLSYYENDAPWSTAKLAALVGDTTSQVVFALMLLPLDSLPWFGSNPSPRSTLSSIFDGCRCMVQCDNNAAYFAMYTAGYLGNRATFLFLNHYSPTLGAFMSQACSPVSSLILLAIPALQTYPTPVVWYLQVVCLALLTFASLLYAAHEHHTRMHVRRKGSVPAVMDP